MPFVFPTSQKHAAATADQIRTYGFAAETLGMCLRFLHPYYDELNQIEMVDGEATTQARKTLDDTRIAIENLLTSLQFQDPNAEPTQAEKIQVNGYLYLAGYTARSTDQLVGKGWASDLIDSTGYAWDKTFGTVIDRGADILDAASKLPGATLNSAGSILSSLGSLGYVAMGLLIILGIGVAASLWKGKVPK